LKRRSLQSADSCAIYAIATTGRYQITTNCARKASPKTLITSKISRNDSRAHSFYAHGHGNERSGESVLGKGRRMRAPGPSCRRRKLSRDVFGTCTTMAGDCGARRKAKSQAFSVRMRLCIDSWNETPTRRNTSATVRLGQFAGGNGELLASHSTAVCRAVGVVPAIEGRQERSRIIFRPRSAARYGLPRERATSDCDSRCVWVAS
jgi:hypothetical protein